MALSIETCVAEHIGDRKEQQDRVSLVPHPVRRGLLLAVLADGMGGHTGGGIAADQVIHKAHQNFELYAPSSETPEQLLREIIEEAHLVIKLTRFTSEKDPHSTAAVLLLQPGRVDWAHCGDSRVYHFRCGKLMARSKDHSVVQELVRTGTISEAEALHHPRRNVLIGCLGSEQPPLIDHGRTDPLVDQDSFLLCSDGLWSYVSDEEMGETVCRHSARMAAEILVERARERAFGSGDNLSLAIIKVVEKKPD